MPAIRLFCSSCRDLSSSDLMPACVCAWRLAHSDTSSLVKTRRSRMAAISRVSTCAEVRSALTSWRQSTSPCFLHSLNKASYCVRAELSTLVSPPSSCSKAVRLDMSSTAWT